jgi:hypothetical protein
MLKFCLPEYNYIDDVCRKTVPTLVSQKRHILIVETEVTSQAGSIILRYSVTIDGLLIKHIFSWSGVDPSPLILRPLLANFISPGLWWKMTSLEESVECLAGETKVLGEKLPQYRFVHHKSHMTCSLLQLGPPRWKATAWATERPADQNCVCADSFF